ncbi:MAG: S-ribosylhomocysteine lyase [Kiritimatiellae bacterium]|nr:S-ribosylhomocysteine lyase [Kiritimatiellia bacterium]
MELIASFQVDHTRIVPGIYVSRVDSVGGERVTTFDVRMKRPNVEPAIHPNAIHTIEHIVATYLRSDPEWKDRIVYWGPMGCLTGNYLIVKGSPSPQEILPLVLAAFRHCRDFEGEVPGTTPETCGNYRLHDLAMAKWESARYVELLEREPCFEYPTAERTLVDGGREFYDS